MRNEQAIPFACNKLQKWGWFESFLKFAGNMVGFAHRQYHTCSLLTNSHALLVLLERFEVTIG